MINLRYVALDVGVTPVEAEIQAVENCTRRKRFFGLVRNQRSPLATAPGAAQRSRDGVVGGSGGGVRGDGVAEGFEVADVVSDGALGAAAGVVEPGPKRGDDQERVSVMASACSARSAHVPRWAVPSSRMRIIVSGRS
jgi:hypothetical protein